LKLLNFTQNWSKFFISGICSKIVWIEPYQEVVLDSKSVLDVIYARKISICSKKFWTDTQLRISCHQLKIETGRYQGTLLHDRKCERCSSGEVEDEYHFLFHCNKLENDRN
jgi:hypothetical protein